ncbi:efflux transporter outer membrane subunit [Phenylobacterium montanum]|uniref:Efflux transporter outer membrane subunit n=1 Tax=Phenylobacterium montanum TaxID=2823693 RepID=A0A975FZE0_9CAUL|nr:efflux transporter outer membrane subunit [Caulobacter sp. S6]QUD88075.1 efflux transporter outer membrane subunit [Caulobacter sp. S6]
MRRPLFLLLAAAGLAGCAVGPRYATPQTPAPAAGSFSSAPAVVTSGDATSPTWWRLYQDPVLDRLVEQALAENLDLKVAAANLDYAEGLVSETRSNLLPSTTLDAGAAYGRSAAANQAAIAAGKSHAKAGWGYSTGFSAAYQVDLFGQVRRAIEAARANAGAAQAAEDAVRVTVAAEATSAYAQACGFAAQAAVARRSLAAAQETFDISRRQREAGAISDFDLARAEAALEQARAAIAPLDGQRRTALLELAALLGKTPSEIPAEAAACVAPPQLAQPLPTGDGATLLRRRPDVRQAERVLASDTARIGVAVAEFYPSVSLGGSIADAAGSVGGLRRPGSISYSLGPLVTWSFPNIALARAHVIEARAQASGALASFDSTVLQALKETEQALTAYGAELDRHGALKAAAARSDEALRLARIQYEAGTISMLDLLTAQATALGADQALAASDQQLALDQVAVFQALGGGWEQAPKVTALKVG